MLHRRTCTALAHPVSHPAFDFPSVRGEQRVLLQRLRVVTGDGGGDAADGGGTFVLATTHLKAGTCGRWEGERAKQAATLLHAVEQFCRADEPVVLGGDFNAHHSPLALDNDGKCLEPLAVPALLRGGFRCAQTEAAGAPHPFSYWAGWVDREVKTCFDHILIRGAGLVAAASLQVPAADEIARGACRLPNAGFPSDHLPLAAEVRLGSR